MVIIINVVAGGSSSFFTIILITGAATKSIVINENRPGFDLGDSSGSGRLSFSWPGNASGISL